MANTVPNTVISHLLAWFETLVEVLQPFHLLWGYKTGTVSQGLHKHEVILHLFWETSHAAKLRHKVDGSAMSTLWHWNQHWLWLVPYFQLIFLCKIKHSRNNYLEASFLGSTRPTWKQKQILHMSSSSQSYEIQYDCLDLAATSGSSNKPTFEKSTPPPSPGYWYDVTSSLPSIHISQ